MSKKLVTPAIVKVIQKAVYVRICDSCGGELEKGERSRALWQTGKKGLQHYHRNTDCDPWDERP